MEFWQYIAKLDKQKLLISKLITNFSRKYCSNFEYNVKITDYCLLHIRARLILSLEYIGP